MSESSRFTAAQRHEAAHKLDDLLTDVVRILRKMIDPAYAIGVQDELIAVQGALQKFHDRVTDVHTVTVREMRN
jgi:hypothetical protein